MPSLITPVAPIDRGKIVKFVPMHISLNMDVGGGSGSVLVLVNALDSNGVVLDQSRLSASIADSSQVSFFSTAFQEQLVKECLRLLKARGVVNGIVS